MDKKLALLFSFAGVLCLVAAGAAVSFRAFWLAGLAILCYVAVLGFGFALKARRRRNS
jgi:hypothetical protein